jgi:hypothetical protein
MKDFCDFGRQEHTQILSLCQSKVVFITSRLGKNTENLPSTEVFFCVTKTVTKSAEMIV